MSKNIDQLKELCLQIPEKGIYYKRALERINNMAELEDFCRRRKINIPKITETRNDNSTSNTVPEPKKPKEKRKSKESKEKRSKPESGRNLYINNSSNIVLGTVNVFNMPVMKMSGRSSTNTPKKFP